MSSKTHPPLEKQVIGRGLPLPHPTLANCQGIVIAPRTVAVWRKATAQAVVLQMSKKRQFHRENKSSKALEGGGSKLHWPAPQPPRREQNPRKQMTALRINGSWNWKGQRSQQRHGEGP